MDFPAGSEARKPNKTVNAAAGPLRVSVDG